ncbi:MAG: RseA family anti-sigma factor [Pseudomonadales bacterium]
MSNQLRESLSALMDGEADELELHRLLSNVSSGQRATVNETWSRYHLVRDVMKNNGQNFEFRKLNIVQQVSDVISNESVPVVTEKSSSFFSSPWLKPVVGFAVAASVTMVVVVGMQSFNQTNPGLSAPVSGQPALASRVYPAQGTSLQASEGVGGFVTYRSTELPGDIASSRAVADLEAQKRLDKYILRHTEQAALNNGQGMISFARVASFEPTNVESE